VKLCFFHSGFVKFFGMLIISDETIRIFYMTDSRNLAVLSFGKLTVSADDVIFRGKRK